jgi:hypothetical protein
MDSGARGFTLRTVGERRTLLFFRFLMAPTPGRQPDIFFGNSRLSRRRRAPAPHYRRQTFRSIVVPTALPPILK